MEVNQPQSISQNTMPIAAKKQEKPAYKMPSMTSFKELLSMDIKKPDYLLHPIIEEQGLTMIHAYRGVGKTHISLNIAYAVAAGCNFLKWKANKPRKVLFIDGEMMAYQLKERLENIQTQQNLTDSQKESARNNLIFITPDMQGDLKVAPDLSTYAGQGEVEAGTDEADLIILDNLSTLCRQGRENEAEDWLIVQDWLLKLRAQGKSILLIHHSGKGGGQRGTSKREDVLNTVIHLKKSEDYKSEEGAHFEVLYEKNRSFYGKDAANFDAKLNQLGWTWQDLELTLHDKIIELKALDLSQVEIAKELGINKSTVSRHLKPKCDAIIRKA